MSGLIFDIGPHEGMDTAYYLHVGANVVAVEADKQIAARLTTRYAREIAQGRLTVLDRAVSDSSGKTLQFHLSKANSWWNSARPEVAGRGGSDSITVTAETITLADLIDGHGMPAYCKIDIEGLDATAVRSLSDGPAPEYISVETECAGDVGESVDPLDTLRALIERGYSRFKLIDQRSLRELRPSEAFYPLQATIPWRIRRTLHRRLKFPALDPHHADRSAISKVTGYRFAYGSTGPFGHQLSGEWLDAQTGERTLLRHRAEYFRTPSAVPWGFWCDWHATL